MIIMRGSRRDFQNLMGGLFCVCRLIYLECNVCAGFFENYYVLDRLD